ncbi:MAG: LysR family transcriptional regulator, partial [Paracoccaceae bacterium]
GRLSLAAPDRAAGRLIAPFPLEVPIDEAFHLIQAPAGSPHPDAAAFTDWLLAEAGRDRPA